MNRRVAQEGAGDGNSLALAAGEFQSSLADRGIMIAVDPLMGAVFTEELVAIGHEVTLFASGDSITNATLQAVWPQALRLDTGIRDFMAPLILLLEHVYEMAQQFHIVHFHREYFPASLFARQNVPFITTLHGRLDLPELKPVYAGLPEQNLISFWFSAPAAAGRPFHRDGASRTTAHAADALAVGTFLCRVPRPDLHRKTAGPGDPHRPRRR